MSVNTNVSYFVIITDGALMLMHIVCSSYLMC